MGENSIGLVSMRAAFGQALADYGAANPNVVVLDADVSASTQTHLFAKRFPERFFNLGVAEANLVDVAAGMALAGLIPFANAFAFLIALRASEQVRTLVCLNKANVKLCGAYSGLSDSFDGPTHHSESDIAVMRAMPGLAVVIAADAVQARKLVARVAEYPGPVYFRLSRAELPVIFEDTHEPEIGKGVQLRQGTDLTLVATGALLWRSLEAAERLSDEGISTRVLNIHSVKPLDVQLLETAARETQAIVTVEEHSVIGGLGGAVCEALSERFPVPVVRVGLRDTFAATGPYFDLLDKFGMGVPDIISAGKRALTLSASWEPGRHPY